MNGNQYGKFFSKGFGNFNKGFSNFSKQLNKSKYQNNFINSNANFRKFSVSLFNNLNFHTVILNSIMNINSSGYAIQKINSLDCDLSQEDPSNANELANISLIFNNNLIELIQSLKGKKYFLIYLIVQLSKRISEVQMSPDLHL